MEATVAGAIVGESSTIEGRLEKLRRLMENGLITQADLDAKSRTILDEL